MSEQLYRKATPDEVLSPRGPGLMGGDNTVEIHAVVPVDDVVSLDAIDTEMMKRPDYGHTVRGDARVFWNDSDLLHDTSMADARRALIDGLDREKAIAFLHMEIDQRPLVMTDAYWDELERIVVGMFDAALGVEGGDDADG